MRRFLKGLAIFILGAILGVGTGTAAGFFVFPYVFPPPVANEALAPTDPARPVAIGSFIHANTYDPLHWGRGRVSVYQTAVFLEADFEVAPGPNYFVYLVPKPDVRSSADVKGAKILNLGQLRSFKGSQRYAIPPGTDLGHYASVVIWCEHFGTLISPAALSVMRLQ